MNTKLFKLSSLSILILTGVLFLAACQGVGGAPIVLAQPDYVVAAPDAAFDYQKSADNQAARWVAMGEFYQENELLTRKLDAGDISAQRWGAMASYYADNPQAAAEYQQVFAAPLSSVSAADAAALRWTAMGEFYQENDLLARKLDAGDISAMRWQAMASFYEYNPQVAAMYQQALAAAPLSSVNAADAAALRWTAMGEFYQENDLLTRELDAGEISAMRWQAMAQFYADQGLLTR